MITFISALEILTLILLSVGAYRVFKLAKREFRFEKTQPVDPIANTQSSSSKLIIEDELPKIEVEETSEPHALEEALTASSNEAIKSKLKAFREDIKNAEQSFAKPVSLDNTEALAKAHRFVEQQLSELPGDVDRDSPICSLWFDDAKFSFLSGAVDHILKQAETDSVQRKNMVEEVLRLKLDPSDSGEQLNLDPVKETALLENQHLVRAGAKAAKMWLKQEHVPVTFSLKSLLDEWQSYA